MIEPEGCDKCFWSKHIAIIYPSKETFYIESFLFIEHLRQHKSIGSTPIGS